jgi:hypothetical protein
VKVAIMDSKLNPWMIVSGVLALLLVITAIMWMAKPTATANATKDTLIYLNSSGCAKTCDDMEPMIRQIATENNLGFSKATYFQGMPVPGYVILHDGTMYIGPIGSENEFVMSLCDITGSQSVCAKADVAEKELEQQMEAEKQKELEGVPKTTKPIVEVFVMSHCPFGTQMEKASIPAAKLLGNKIDFRIEFVSYAMHGEKEVYEQLNQYCIMEEQESKFLPYLECFLEAGDGEGCITKAKIDAVKLEACAKKADEEFDITKNFEDQASWLSGRFPKFDIHKELNEKYGIQGSPGFVVNGKVMQVNRDPKSVLAAICSGFETEPEECQETLSSTPASAGFGYSEGAAGTTATCG